MKHISDLFSRYQNKIKPPQSSIVKEFVSVCEERCGFKLKEEQCSYTVSTKTIYLTVPSILKSEVMRNKKTILQSLKDRLGINAPVEII